MHVNSVAICLEFGSKFSQAAETQGAQKRQKTRSIGEWQQRDMQQTKHLEMFHFRVCLTNITEFPGESVREEILKSGLYSPKL